MSTTTTENQIRESVARIKAALIQNGTPSQRKLHLAEFEQLAQYMLNHSEHRLHSQAQHVQSGPAIMSPLESKTFIDDYAYVRKQMMGYIEHYIRVCIGVCSNSIESNTIFTPTERQSANAIVSAINTKAAWREAMEILVANDINFGLKMVRVEQRLANRSKPHEEGHQLLQHLTDWRQKFDQSQKPTLEEYAHCNEYMEYKQKRPFAFWYLHQEDKELAKVMASIEARVVCNPKPRDGNQPFPSIPTEDALTVVAEHIPIKDSSPAANADTASQKLMAILAGKEAPDAEEVYRVVNASYVVGFRLDMERAEGKMRMEAQADRNCHNNAHAEIAKGQKQAASADQVAALAHDNDALAHKNEALNKAKSLQVESYLGIERAVSMRMFHEKHASAVFLHNLKRRPDLAGKDQEMIRFAETLMQRFKEMHDLAQRYIRVLDRQRQ